MKKRTYFLMIVIVPVIISLLLPLALEAVTLSDRESMKIHFRDETVYRPVVLAAMSIAGSLGLAAIAVNVQRFAGDRLCRGAVYVWTWILTGMLVLFGAADLCLRFQVLGSIYGLFGISAETGFPVTNFINTIDRAYYFVAWIVNAAFYWAMAIKLRQMERQGNAGEKGGG